MKLLLVIDFQNDFVEGSLGFSQAKLLENGIYQKILTYQANKDDVAYTFDTHNQQYLNSQEGKKLPVPHCIEQTRGWELYGRISELDGYRLYKNTFGAEQLFVFLKNRQYESIELVGLVTNICVLANAVIAKTAMPETPILVDAACCASYDEVLHQKALDIMAGLHIEIINRR